MYEIYLTRKALDEMSRDYLYLLLQTMRIFNCLKVFVLIGDDIKRYGPHDLVNEKKLLELLFYHASNLNEILAALTEDLLPRYRAEINDSTILVGLSKWEKKIKKNDETVRVLSTIRNKHSFHVAYDPFYLWKYIKDQPATSDMLIGVGETMQGSGWFFTKDNENIIAFLADHALDSKTGNIEDYFRIRKIIDETSVDLYHLFETIVTEMLHDKIYNKGNKEQASRDYREDLVDHEGT